MRFSRILNSNQLNLHDLVDIEQAILEPEEESQVKKNQVVGRIELAALPFEVGFQKGFHGVAVVRVLLTERRLEKLIWLTDATVAPGASFNVS